MEVALATNADTVSSTSDRPAAWWCCGSEWCWPGAVGPSPGGFSAPLGLSDQYCFCYTTIAAAGKRANLLATRLTLS